MSESREVWLANDGMLLGTAILIVAKLRRLHELWSGIMRRRCAARSSDNVYNVYLRKRSSDNISTPPPASALAREAAARLSRPFPRLLVKT